MLILSTWDSPTTRRSSEESTGSPSPGGKSSSTMACAYDKYFFMTPLFTTLFDENLAVRTLAKLQESRFQLISFGF